MGELIALATVLVWGLTFVSTKVLLTSFLPVEILITRFILGFLGLCVLRPRILKLKDRKHELLFIAAGATGVAAYFLFENSALTFCTASLVAVVVDSVPLFTAILAFVTKTERSLSLNFFIGFVLAMAGIVLISFQDHSPEFSFWGVVLALGAACSWAVYCLVLARINKHGYETLATTKRIFLWGIVISALVSPLFGMDITNFDFSRYLNWTNAGNLLFLGLIASALCFVTWGIAVEKIGPTKTCIFVYAQPVLSIVAGVLILGEPFTWKIVVGFVLVTIGVVLSEGHIKLRKPKQEK